MTVPLFPSKYWNPGIARVKVAENYSWSYLVKSNTNDLIGQRYNTGSRINTFIELNWRIKKFIWNLQQTFIEKDIGYIFRMKYNSNYFLDMKFETSKVIKINGKDVQLFK